MAFHVCAFFLGDPVGRTRSGCAARSRLIGPLLLLLPVLAGGCGGRLQEIGREPELSAVGSGLKRPVATAASTEAEEFRSAKDGGVAAHRMPASYSDGNSLWRDRGADLFKDPRARRMGDILTVTISMKDKASLDNSSKRSRDASHGLGLDVSQSFDWGAFKSEGTGTAASAIKANTSQDGKGAIARSENIDLRIAAVVVNVLPNGNLLIQGTQEVLVNYEMRVLTFTGIVDTRDIKADNTIPHERIAEARMSYGGRGRIMEVQQPGWGHQIIDSISPF